jgi:hypothetical protein
MMEAPLAQLQYPRTATISSHSYNIVDTEDLSMAKDFTELRIKAADFTEV